MAGSESSIKAIFYAFLANLGIAIAKGLSALFTGSGSMLAEAVHSLADCSNQILLYLGIKRSQRDATPEHPLGYGKVIYFWSFIVAILLFSMGGLFSIYEGVHKISSSEEIKYPWVALGVLLFSIVLESFSLLGAIKEINKIKGKKYLWEWIKSTRSAELVVVLGEDTAALLGLSVAMIFVLLTYLTNDPFYDALGSIFIGVILLVISVFLFLRIKSLIIGRSADPEIQFLIEKEIKENEHILNVFNIITVQMGPHIVLAAKIKFKPDIPIQYACEIINKIEEKIKSKFSEVKWCFIEPDIKN